MLLAICSPFSLKISSEWWVRCGFVHCEVLSFVLRSHQKAQQSKGWCARASLEEVLKTAKAEVPKFVHPQQSGRSVRTWRDSKLVKVLGEDNSDGRCIETAKVQVQVRPVGERFNLCLQHPREETSRTSRASDCEQRRRDTHAIAQNPAPWGKPWTSTPWRSRRFCAGSNPLPTPSTVLGSAS